MTVFVHLADERDAAAIRRSGLKLPRTSNQASVENASGVFAMPVTPDFFVTHQWLRELKRRGFNVAVGVYFRIPDSELVWAGLYNGEKHAITAAQAAMQLTKERTLGYEVLIPRSINASEIRAVRALPQLVGWRYYPDAHRQGVFCACKFCLRGQIKSKKLVEKFEAQ